MRRLSDAIHAFLKSRAFYPLVFLAAAAPLAHLVWRALPVFVPLVAPDVDLGRESDLGANPIETLLHETGRDALLLLIATLSITPLRRWTGWNRLQLVRRMVGVWSFAYAAVHVLIYVVFNHLGNVRVIWEDVTERPFIFAGMVTFVLLSALAVTSTNGMMRRLGRQWTRLHRLVYAAAVAATVHFAWGQKADITEPLQWGAVLSVLLGMRVYWAVTRRQRTASRSAVSH
jgi:sulfoxide reductase heme-binding subunit YedZ